MYCLVPREYDMVRNDVPAKYRRFAAAIIPTGGVCIVDTRLKRLIDDVMPKVIEIRRDIHRHPELSGEEERTASRVADILSSLGIEFREGIGGNGVVGAIRGAGGPGRVCALRADMDALPMTEQTNLAYSSETEGVMHACGHDTHTAMLLGAAMVLARMKDDFAGTVKFVFQPAEEANPTGGAPAMIEAGALEDPHVDAMVGLHVWPSLATGEIGIRPGAMMGASDRVFVTVRGRSSHGSEPDRGVDAIAAAGQILSAFQTIVSRNVSPLDAAVLSIGTIRGGYRYNVIADEVVMEGTVRTLSPKVQDMMPERIRQIAGGIATAFGATAEIRYVKGYPPLLNDPTVTATVREALHSVSGARVLDVEHPAMGGEDFSFFARVVPSAFLWLGCRPEGVDPATFAPVHNTGFTPDEACFPYGVEALVRSAISVADDRTGR